jgi:hypothetical protein
VVVGGGEAHLTTRSKTIRFFKNLWRDHPTAICESAKRRLSHDGWTLD